MLDPGAPRVGRQRSSSARKSSCGSRIGVETAMCTHVQRRVAAWSGLRTGAQTRGSVALRIRELRERSCREAAWLQGLAYAVPGAVCGSARRPGLVNGGSRERCTRRSSATCLAQPTNRCADQGLVMAAVESGTSTQRHVAAWPSLRIGRPGLDEKAAESGAHAGAAPRGCLRTVCRKRELGVKVAQSDA